MKKILLLVLFVTSLFAREYIAIVDFEGIGISENEARSLTQRLTSEMINLEVYQVVERSEMKRLLDEQKFQYSGCVDMKCAVQIGKMIGAKFMVVGSISSFGSTYSIDARLINVETSESYIGAKYDASGATINRYMPIDVLMRDGMASIAHQLSEVTYKSKIINDSKNITNQIPKVKQKSKVASVKNQYISYKDDNKILKKSQMVSTDYYYKGHQLHLLNDSKIYGNFLGTNSNLIYYSFDQFIKNIKCENVNNIYDGTDTQIEFDCSTNTFFPKD